MATNNNVTFADGSSTLGRSGGYDIYAHKFRLNAPMRVDSVDIKAQNGTGTVYNFDLLLWDSAGVLILNKTCSLPASALMAWRNFAISSLKLDAGRDYYIGIKCDPIVAPGFEANTVLPKTVTASVPGKTLDILDFRHVNGSSVSTTNPPPVSANKHILSIRLIGSFNNPPTIVITSPSDNQTLSEGTAYPIEGSATDADANSNVVIKCQINNGPIRNIGSGVSDGITPISFARTLMYRDKRIWDGSADIAGADLAENTDHVLKVWAEDDQGGVSDEVIRTFRVIWNRPPTISGQDENLGTISTPPNQTYSVTDPEGHSFTIEEYLDGELLRSFPGVAGQEYTATIPFDKWLRTSLAQHALRIRATDSAGQFAERIYTFTRTDDRIEFTLNYDDPNIQNFFILDDKPTRILVTLDGTFPSGCKVKVEACNNALDDSPTWEDITGPVLAGRGYIFQNATKTAAQWAINIRITIEKGTAIEPVILNGFGGAFD
jgi:hypothetical protein